jgi:hypothetical protein
MLIRSTPVPFTLLSKPSQSRAATAFLAAYMSQALGAYNLYIPGVRFSETPNIRLSYICAHMRDSEFYERDARFYLTVDARALWENLASAPHAPVHRSVLGVHSEIGDFGAGQVETEYAFAQEHPADGRP